MSFLKRNCVNVIKGMAATCIIDAGGELLM